MSRAFGAVEEHELFWAMELKMPVWDWMVWAGGACAIPSEVNRDCRFPAAGLSELLDCPWVGEIAEGCGTGARGGARWWLSPCWVPPREFVSAAASAAAAPLRELSALSRWFPTPSAAGLRPSCSSVSETRFRLVSVLTCSCLDMMRETITLITFN